jgi:hypothetical protein
VALPELFNIVFLVITQSVNVQLASLRVMNHVAPALCPNHKRVAFVYVVVRDLAFSPATTGKGPHLLLMGHKQRGGGQRHWGVPGGMRDQQDHSALENAAREFAEELLGWKKVSGSTVDIVLNKMNLIGFLSKTTQSANKQYTAWTLVVDTAKNFEQMFFPGSDLNPEQKYQKDLSNETRGYAWFPLPLIVTKNASGQRVSASPPALGKGPLLIRSDVRHPSIAAFTAAMPHLAAVPPPLAAPDSVVSSSVGTLLDELFPEHLRMVEFNAPRDGVNCHSVVFCKFHAEQTDGSVPLARAYFAAPVDIHTRQARHIALNTAIRAVCLSKGVGPEHVHGELSIVHARVTFNLYQDRQIPTVFTSSNQRWRAPWDHEVYSRMRAMAIGAMATYAQVLGMSIWRTIESQNCIEFVVCNNLIARPNNFLSNSLCKAMRALNTN